MKRILLTILTFTLIINVVQAQYPRASIWETHMANFAKEDSINGIMQNQVLFTGSSSFTLWKSLQDDFPESDLLNRGFGGSHMSDLIYFFDNIIKPYAPAQVVIYEGDNDLAFADFTPLDFMADVITICRMIQVHFPQAEIILVSVKPSPSRAAHFDKYRAANTLMSSFADSHSHIKYVDIWDAMLLEDGTVNKELFKSDMLHMNSKGYDVWIDKLKPHIMKR